MLAKAARCAPSALRSTVPMFLRSLVFEVSQRSMPMIRSSHLQEAAETIELQGVEIEDLKGQLRKVKTMLTQHNTTLMGMEDTGCVTDSCILKAL